MATDDDPARSVARDMRRWDPHSRRVVAAGLVGVLRSLELDLGPRWEEVAADLPATSRRPDLVFISPLGVGLHVEVQQVPRSDMAWRMADYAVRLREAPTVRSRMTDLVQVVVQVTGPPMVVDYRFGGMANRVHLLHVPATAPADFLTTESLAPFALIRGGAPLVHDVVGAMAAVEDPEVRGSMAALALYLVPELASTIIEEIRRLGMTDLVAELRQSDFGRELLAEGREEGREEGQRRMLLAMLATRFPTADRSQLERTAARLLSAGPVTAASTALTLTELDEG